MQGSVCEPQWLFGWAWRREEILPPPDFEIWTYYLAGSRYTDYTTTVPSTGIVKILKSKGLLWADMCLRLGKNTGISEGFRRKNLLKDSQKTINTNKQILWLSWNCSYKVLVNYQIRWGRTFSGWLLSQQFRKLRLHYPKEDWNSWFNLDNNRHLKWVEVISKSTELFKIFCLRTAVTIQMYMYHCHNTFTHTARYCKY